MTEDFIARCGPVIWVAAVRWPDGRHRELDVVAENPAAVEKYCQDIWGWTVTVTVTPKEVAD